MQDLSQFRSVLKQHGYRADESIVLLMRLQLMNIIKGEIEKRNWSQREAAKILGVSQPRIAEISVLATERFSVELLIKFIYRLGLRPALKITKSKHYEKPKRPRNSLKRKPNKKEESSNK